jgi:DNA modification methylase
MSEDSTIPPTSVEPTHEVVMGAKASDSGDDMRTESIIMGSAEKLGNHPAKMHSDLALALVEDYSAAGDVVLDPFAGCGTTLWAAAQRGRKGLGVDIEPAFANQAKKHGAVILGDSTSIPLPTSSVDAIVTSPPYGEAVGRAGDRDPKKTTANKQRYEEKRFGRKLTPHAVYGYHPRNIGTLPLSRRNAPCFVDSMPKVMEEMVRVVKPGGFIAVVVKDQRLGRRELGVYDLPSDIVKWGKDAGAIFWGRRFGIIPPASWTLWQRVNFRRWGYPIPDVEHVLVLRKPKTAQTEKCSEPKKGKTT